MTREIAQCDGDVVFKHGVSDLIKTGLNIKGRVLRLDTVDLEKVLNKRAGVLKIEHQLFYLGDLFRQLRRRCQRWEGMERFRSLRSM